MSDRNYGALRLAGSVETLIDRIIAQDVPFAFDIETGYDGPDVENGAKMPYHPAFKLVGISFTTSEDWARYVPIGHDDGDNVDDELRVCKAFWRLVNTGNGIAHNVAFELKGLSRWFRTMLWNDPEYGPEVRASKGLFPFLCDTMLLVWLTGIYEPAVSDITMKDLKKISRMAFGLQMTEFGDLFPKEDSDMGPATKRGGTKFIRFNTRSSRSPRVVSYACEDSVASFMLFNLHWDEMKDDFITKVEMAAVPSYIEMEMGPLDENGVPIGNMYLDWKHLREKNREVATFRDRFEEEILAEFSERLGRPITVNLNAAPQMQKIIYDPFPQGLGIPINDRFRSKKTNAPSAGEDALKVIAKQDPLIRKVLDYRQVAKLYNSYTNKYITQLNYAGTGHVFPSHNQAGTVTGRISVDQVSYQQWPKPYHYELKDGTSFDMNFRDLLVSPPNHRIIGFDFSQVELRVLAGVSNETAMLKAFADGEDIHRRTASIMFNIPLDKVTKKDRGKGKTMNFGIVYGIGPDAIAEDISASGEPMTKEGAEKLLQQYYDAFPKLRAWMDKMIAAGHEEGHVFTPFGRRFTVWEYKARQQWIRNKGDRMCVNAPIQGGAADYMKIGLVRMLKALRKAEEDGLVPVGYIRPFMNVHDAQEFYVHESVPTQFVIDLFQPCFTFPVSFLPEIKADWHEGPLWGSTVDIKLDENAQIHHYEIEDVPEKFDTIEEAYAYQEKVAMEALVNESPEKTAERVQEPGGATNDAPMALADPDSDDPPWAASKDFTEGIGKTYVIGLSEMPDSDQWSQFKDWLAHSKGSSKVILRLPDGDIEMDGRYKVADDDQGIISLLLGGATLALLPSEEIDADAIMEGVKL